MLYCVFSRSITGEVVRRHALVAQTVEHILGKNEVMGSSPIEGFSGACFIGSPADIKGGS